MAQIKALVFNKLYLLKEVLIKGHNPYKRERITKNINLDLTKKRKRVLIVYLDYFLSSIECERNVSHTNHMELFQIVQCFIKLDYVIDVCACYDIEEISNINANTYNVIFGMGEVFRQVICNSNAFKILYLTENPYYLSYQKEQERTEYFYKRNGKRIPLFRTGLYFKEDDEKNADGIVCLCDDKYLEKNSVPVQRVFPSGFSNEGFKIENTNRVKENFLVLGTGGFIHKGIDLLLEIFHKNTQWNLYLCGADNSANMRALGYGLNNSNIFDCGFVDVKSKEFYEIVNKCTFILSASCSEAFSTAILTGMRHGMIPIVMHDNGMDHMEKFCYYFDNYELDTIEGKIRDLINLPEERLKKQSMEIYEYANNEFSLKRFTERMYKALEELLGGL